MNREGIGCDGCSQLSSPSRWPHKRPGPEQPQKQRALGPCHFLPWDRQGEGSPPTIGKFEDELDLEPKLVWKLETCRRMTVGSGYSSFKITPNTWETSEGRCH